MPAAGQSGEAVGMETEAGCGGERDRTAGEGSRARRRGIRTSVVSQRFHSVRLAVASTASNDLGRGLHSRVLFHSYHWEVSRTVAISQQESDMERLEKEAVHQDERHRPMIPLYWVTCDLDCC